MRVVVRTAFIRGEASESVLRKVVRCNVAVTGKTLGVDGRIDDTDGTVGDRMVRRGNKNEFTAVGDRLCLEHTVRLRCRVSPNGNRIRSIRLHGPEILVRDGVAVDVVPPSKDQVSRIRRRRSRLFACCYIISVANSFLSSSRPFSPLSSLTEIPMLRSLVLTMFTLIPPSAKVLNIR